MARTVTKLPEVLTEKEVSRLLRVSVDRLRELRWRRKPGTVESGPVFMKIGRSVRYQRTDVLDYMRMCRERGLEIAAQRERNHMHEQLTKQARRADGGSAA